MSDSDRPFERLDTLPCQANLDTASWTVEKSCSTGPLDGSSIATIAKRDVEWA